jgi:transposase
MLLNRGDHRHAGCESDRKGIKRNALVDTEGHLLSLEIIPANIQDRDCAAGLIEKALEKFPRLKKIFAGWRLCRAETRERARRATGGARNCQTHRQGWRLQGPASSLVIERTFSWLRRNRRLMAHYEALAMIALGFAKLAMIAVMLKRLTQVTP